jgi:hypothetical protein
MRENKLTLEPFGQGGVANRITQSGNFHIDGREATEKRSEMSKKKKGRKVRREKRKLVSHRDRDAQI